MINETIDTIPLYDEKSFENVSFKEDVNELFERKNIVGNKKFFLSDTNKKELNKNKYLNNIKNNNKKKNNNEQKITDNNKTIKPLSKIIPTLSLTPNKNKEIPQENNYNYTDRIINNQNNNYTKNQFILENNSNNKNNIKISELKKISKVSEKIKDNDDIIVINKNEEKIKEKIHI